MALRAGDRAEYVGIVKRLSGELGTVVAVRDSIVQWRPDKRTMLTRDVWNCSDYELKPLGGPDKYRVSWWDGTGLPPCAKCGSPPGVAIQVIAGDVAGEWFCSFACLNGRKKPRI